MTFTEKEQILFDKNVKSIKSNPWMSTEKALENLQNGEGLEKIAKYSNYNMEEIIKVRKALLEHFQVKDLSKYKNQ